MSRIPYMCKYCKLDKEGICNYECIECKFKLFVCPKFIYDNGQAITNAELLCSDLRDNIELAATGLWYQLAMDDGFETYEDFVKWLKKKAVID